MTKYALLLLSLTSALAACADGRAQGDIAPRAGDFSAAIALREAGECRFDPLTEHAFEGLMLIGWEPDGVTHAPFVAIGEARLAPELESAAMETVPDGREYRAHAALPAGSLWHGLRIEKLWVEFHAPPETDSLYRRGIHFAATPDELRVALAAQGADVPLAPNYRELVEYAAFSGGTCGGAILIEEDSGGASLVCERGC